MQVSGRYDVRVGDQVDHLARSALCSLFAPLRAFRRYFEAYLAYDDVSHDLPARVELFRITSSGRGEQDTQRQQVSNGAEEFKKHSLSEAFERVFSSYIQ